MKDAVTTLLRCPEPVSERLARSPPSCCTTPEKNRGRLVAAEEDWGYECSTCQTPGVGWAAKGARGDEPGGVREVRGAVMMRFDDV